MASRSSPISHKQGLFGFRLKESLVVNTIPNRSTSASPLIPSPTRSTAHQVVRNCPWRYADLNEAIAGLCGDRFRPRKTGSGLWDRLQMAFFLAFFKMVVIRSPLNQVLGSHPPSKGNGLQPTIIGYWLQWWISLKTHLFCRIGKNPKQNYPVVDSYCNP